MSWKFGLAGHHHLRRRRIESLRGNVEVLERRALLADGITPAAGPPITAAAGVPVRNAVFATYTVTDPTGQPGTQWRGLINFGDGQHDGPLIPVEMGQTFAFVDTHTYKTPGTYTVTVMIAVPGSMMPNDNTVTTTVTVTSSMPTPTPTPMPTPTPTSPPLIGPLKASGLKIKARANRTFHGDVARLSDPHAQAQGFRAVIDWGDGSPSTPGQVRPRAKGKFAVVGTHQYAGAGVFPIRVTILDAAGNEVAAVSRLRLRK
jgi:hypothetical protein